MGDQLVQQAEIERGEAPVVLRQRRVSIRIVLLATFGAIALAGATAFVLVLQSGRQNTIDLVRDRTERILNLVIERTRLHLDPVREQSEFLARLIKKGILDPTDRETFGVRLTLALAATPQVEALAFIDTDHQQLRVERKDDGSRVRTFDMRDTPGVSDALEEARDVGRSIWGELVWSHQFRQPLVNLRTPLWQENKFIGVLFATVTVAELSNFLAKSPAGHDTNAFILYRRKYVIAHPALVRDPPQLGFDRPLPALGDLGDPVLAAFWSPDREPSVAAVLTGVSKGHIAFIENVPYVFVYRYLSGYSDRPWLIGRYFRRDALEGEVRRLVRAAWTGLIIFAIALVGAWWMGDAITRPIRRLAAAAERVREKGVHDVPELPRNRLTELDTAATAFNEMATGLRERELIRETFGKFVPEGIADAILADRGVLKPQTRVATILFTDIAGFSTLAETVTPERLVAMLNEYFATVIEPIERNGGVIDQFQGDAILATYNLPLEDPDHAEKAVRTAIEIQEALAEKRFDVGDGGRAVHLVTRVGINTGTVVGGTVGASSRLGYTVHGDAVNVAARIEEMNKRYGTRLLVAQSTVDLAGAEFDFLPVGEVPVRGRQLPVTLYRVAGSHSREESFGGKGVVD
ncbi:MAG: adenylate/guanylate cyclase domain-containing protein [Proteobacteria bacterium]|nr:adenylate/guanylate cyclase domain-containing protein [Pseudomonadota bacterium]